MPANPHIEIIARAVIICGDHALLCRHPPGKYLVFPGGHVEFGEPAGVALAREIHEEIGLKLRVGRCLAIQEHLFEQKGKPKHEINLMFHVEHPSGWQPGSPPILVSPEAPKVELVWVHKSAVRAAEILPEFARTLLENRLCGGPAPQTGGVAWIASPS